MLKNFRTYHLAVQLYRDTKAYHLPYYLKDQLQRASLSVCLNLAEGSGKTSKKDRLRFYRMAFSSLREVQGLILAEEEKLKGLESLTDRLGAHLYKLCDQ